MSTYEWLKQDKIDVIPHFVNSPLEALKAVSVGRADAYIGNLAAVSYMIEKNGLANLKIAAPTTYDSYNLYFAVRKDWPQLVSMINKVLGAMNPEEHAEIRNRLLPVRYEYGIKKADLLKWGLGISGIAAPILILILFWNRTLSREIRERKQAEEALRESEERFRSAIINAPYQVMIHAEGGEVLQLSKSWTERTGYTYEEIPTIYEWAKRAYGQNELDKDVMEDINNMYKLRGAERQDDGIRPVIIKSGKTRYWDFSTAPLGVLPDGRHLVISMAIDVTKRKQDEEQIKSSLKEKEILLSEIHHRVKNNMQVITSLLRLQSAKIEDKKYVDVFKDNENRIKSMALIHEKLYQSKDFANIDFNDYIMSIANSLIRGYSVTPDKIKLHTEIDDIRLGLDHSIHCGLIINELVSNSLKYAFPKDEAGTIKVTLRSINDREIELAVNDNGIGIPEEVDIDEAESLGLQLVRILAEDQLEGEIDLNRDGGTEFKIRFKK